MSFRMQGARVLITGGAGGMGRIYAERALREGAAHVALWDRDGAALAATVAELSTAHPRATVAGTEVDLGDTRSIVDRAQDYLADGGAPQVLVNNAGIVRGALFWDHEVRDIEGTMQVNAVAPMVLTRELLPAMIASRRPARILNIASAAGTIANPRMSVYAASKWAMIGWSDSVRLELERTGNDHVRVTTFCPSYVSTGMFDGARGPLLTPILTPKTATDRAWQAMLAGRPVRATPWTVPLGRALRGVLPSRVWDVVADKGFRVYNTMDEFRGRSGAGPSPRS
ncbi:short-subunit dehydrogenase [Flavimobilis soli]|uniref:Short-subunit dehydrogenase n=1 Tax=Flavimobilis soli TaxID=442709 RepID=A0A2A9EB39_9MICO|nr:SDR family NAD(P)-dependent oxidoreductase [Flavimobilis soli]PFG35409.1 short-subunit dehydrogenase [Flavimobilis soli]